MKIFIQNSNFVQLINSILKIKNIKKIQKMSSVKKPNRRGRQKKQLMDEQDLQKQQQYEKNESKNSKLNQINDNMFDTAKLDKNYFARAQIKNDNHQDITGDIMNFQDDQNQNPNPNVDNKFDKTQKSVFQEDQTVTNTVKTQKKRRRKPAKKQNIFGQEDQDQEDQSNLTSNSNNKNTDDKLMASQKKQEKNISKQTEGQKQINKKLFQEQQSNKKYNTKQTQNKKIQEDDQQISQEQQKKQIKTNQHRKKQQKSPQKQQEQDQFDNAINQKQNNEDDEQQKVIYLHKQIRKLTNIQDKKDYYHRPLPKNTVAYGYFKRYSAGLSENYQFSGEDHVPLLFCQNQRGCIGCNYYISLTKEMDKNKPSYLGKLRGNAAGSVYFLYDDGIQPKNQINRSEWRTTYAAIQYQSNFMGMNGPRKLKVTIPSPKLASDMDTFKLSEQQSLTNFKPPVVAQYRNKTPKWNDKLKSYALNFGGRVKLASIKNFILISNQFEIQDQQQADNTIVFGKVDESTFSVEYRHPLSLFQAFGIVMSEFDFKLSCQ